VDFAGVPQATGVPAPIIHGDDDQMVPIGAAGLSSAKIVEGAGLTVCPGVPHGPTPHGPSCHGGSAGRPVARAARPPSHAPPVPSVALLGSGARGDPA
jgi:hypothetical protein